jgi:hypothetical protein
MFSSEERKGFPSCEKAIEEKEAKIRKEITCFSDFSLFHTFFFSST